VRLAWKISGIEKRLIAKTEQAKGSGAYLWSASEPEGGDGCYASAPFWQVKQAQAAVDRCLNSLTAGKP
jgi:hypothetical protein